jgi:hypothetical protein
MVEIVVSRSVPARKQGQPAQRHIGEASWLHGRILLSTAHLTRCLQDCGCCGAPIIPSQIGTILWSQPSFYGCRRRFYSWKGGCTSDQTLDSYMSSSQYGMTFEQWFLAPSFVLLHSWPKLSKLVLIVRSIGTVKFSSTACFTRQTHQNPWTDVE